MLSKSFIFLTLIAFAFAGISDFTKNAKNRSFNPLEGKVPIVRIEMDENDYLELNKTVQLSTDMLVTQYNLDASLMPEYETKVTMKFELDGEVKEFKKVNFKTGGQWARTNAKIGFNLKLKGSDSLYDRKNLRLRPDASDATHIRSKIALDLMNNWGIPTVQTTYVEFYLNGEYFGLYTLLDAIKPAWVKTYFNLPEEAEVKSLYQCKKDGMDFTENSVPCVNEKDEYLNDTKAFDDLIKNVINAKNIDELAEIVDIELMMKNVVVEFLYGSYDHFLMNGHNFYLYQESENSKWKMFEYDYDSEFGNGMGTFTQFVLQREPKDVALMTFLEHEKYPKPIVDLLYTQDNTLFKKILRELLITGFNPDNIFPRIDELIEFLAPYVQKTITPDANGNLPGAINKIGNPSIQTMEEFYGNSNDQVYQMFVPGLKSFIQAKFDFVIKEYGFDKQEIVEAARVYRETGEIPKIKIEKEGKKCIVKVILKKQKENK